MAISSLCRAHLPEHHHCATLERLREPESSAAGGEEGDGRRRGADDQRWRRGAGPAGLRPVPARHRHPPPQHKNGGGDTGRLKDRKGTGSGDSYKVLLLDDPRHTEKHVETARQLFHESRQKGAELVIVAVKEHAEFYAQMMVRHGLRSAIEPDSDMAT